MDGWIDIQSILTSIVTSLSSQDELLNKFNVQVEGKLFLLADEAGELIQAWVGGSL